MGMGVQTCSNCEVVVITDALICDKCGLAFKVSDSEVSEEDLPVTFTVESMHLDKMKSVMTEAEFHQYLLTYNQNKLIEEQIRLAKSPRSGFGVGMLFPIQGNQGDDSE